MRSIRFQFLGFISALLLILLLLLNTYPLTSARDAVFEEKRSSLSGQAAVIGSSLAGLDSLDGESVAEVLRVLNISGFSRIMVVDESGAVLYNSSGVGGESASEDLSTALNGKVVVRSRFADSAFSSSCAMPISYQGELSGAVFVAEHDTERAEIILTVQNRIRVLSVIIGAAALVLAGIFMVLLMSRLRELVRSMHIVAGGTIPIAIMSPGRMR